MPHINRIRVNNVKYNFGTQFYDDFLMRFSCKNTIYDLANGGGKSVLMLLLLQNLIPNCTLDDKQPIEKLFRTNEGSTTIHSLIEWTLSDAHVKDNFKYMLTGFCARKAKESSEADTLGNGGNGSGADGKSGKNSSSIEYFNYVIFYRKFNDNDIKNLPLSNGKERITYTGLKNYLKDLDKKDMSLQVKIFETKGDYQRFIAMYGLYESEWEIIRGINKTEGHVRTYFETKYKTTRKVVEDLLIEGIIEKSFKNNYLEDGSDDKLAQTLLDIKDKLIELSQKKDEINNFDRQSQIIGDFMERVTSVKQMYLDMDEAFMKIRKIYNSIAAVISKDEGVKAGVNEQLEFGLNEKKNLGRKVETARVILEKSRLRKIDAALVELEEEYENFNTDIEALEEKLSVMEGGNYYIEYVEAKKEYDKLISIMDNIMKDNGELLSRLKEMVAFKKIADAEEKSRLETEINKEEESRSAEIEKAKELEASVKKLSDNLAVNQYEAEKISGEMDTLDREIADLKNETSLLLPNEAGNAKKTKLAEKDSLTLEKEKLNKDLENARNSGVELKLEYQKYDNALKGHMAERENLENKAAKILNSEEKLSKLKEVYQENDTEKLGEIIEKSYKTMILSIQKDRKELDRLESKLENLKEGKPFGESEGLKKTLEYIRRYHSQNAITGGDLLAGMEEEDRVNAVRYNPVLPYCIVVFEKAEQIASDWEIGEISDNGELVPIIAAESEADLKELLTNSEILDNEKFICVMGNPENFKQSNLEIQIDKLEKIIEEKQHAYNRKKENEAVIKEDYLFVKLVSNELVDEAQINPKKVMEELNEKIKNENTMLDSVQQRIYDNGINQESIINEIAKTEKLALDLDKEIEIFDKIDILLGKYDAAQQQSKKLEQSVSNGKKELNENTKHLEALKNMTQNREKRIQTMRNEIEAMEKDWNEKYAAYYDERVYRTVFGQDSSKFNLNESELEGIMTALKADNASFTDKEKLINNYQISMQRSLQRIDYLGLSTDMFENMLRNKDLSRVTNQDMQGIRREIEEVKGKRKEFRKNVDEKRSERDKLNGSISHTISMIEKEYGEYDEDCVKKEEVSTFINENGELLTKLNDRIASLNSQLKTLEEREMLMQVLKKDCERLMERGGIKPDIQAGTLVELEADKIDGEYHQAAKDLDSFINTRFKRGEQFEKELAMLIDTLKKLGAVELASEIRINISMPESAKEADEMSEAFKETCQYIALERERVVKGLADIQVIKDNFEKQCIQSCINIRTELERLTRLSKINMDGESVSIINLKIPYVNEELYQDRMSDYIDRIAKGADSYEKPEEKLKYIRNNLCWKKMFSVIVTDMNGIRLNLYKRERIAAQSRYLPYEEAVGSTGQSQGIYIQFLIAIINYISSINSKNSDATALRKVIFIDNPFGAAKDIYIWEPIFKLLKTNNVQLVVPARGVTPAITGRFDVNYVLGQKVKNGKQQTVVVDYFSNVKNEELDYTTLSFEQTKLF